MGRQDKQKRSASARGLSSVFGLPRLRQDDARSSSSQPQPGGVQLDHHKTKPTNRGRHSVVVPPLSALHHNPNDPPLSPRSASSPTPSSPPSESRRSPATGRKFSLPENAYPSAHHHQSPASPRRLLKSLSASLRALRVYSRTTSMVELGPDAPCTTESPRSRRSGSIVEEAASGSSSSSSSSSSHRRRRKESIEKRVGDALTAPITLSAFLGASSASCSTSASGLDSEPSETDSTCTSSVRWRASLPRLDELSTSEAYRLLFGQLAIKVVYHRCPESGPSTREEEGAGSKKRDKVEGSGEEEQVDAALSAEHLLRKYFFAEQEQKRLEQLRRQEAEGDDISLVAFRKEDTDGGKLTFGGLLARLDSLYPSSSSSGEDEGSKRLPIEVERPHAELDQDCQNEGGEHCRFAVYYDDGEGDRIRVRDTSSLQYAWRDWWHRQRQARNALLEEERQERRKRWRAKMAQIEFEEREKKRAMLAQVGNMKLMLRAGRRSPTATLTNNITTTPTAPTTNSDAGSHESAAQERPTSAPEQQQIDETPESQAAAAVRRRKEQQEKKQLRRAKLRGSSLKLHVYEQRFEELSERAHHHNLSI